MTRTRGWRVWYLLPSPILPSPILPSPLSHLASPFSLSRSSREDHGGCFSGRGGCGISERLKSGSGDYVGVHVRRAEFNLSGPSHGSVRLTYFEGTERPLSPTGFKGSLHEMFDGDGEGNRASQSGGAVERQDAHDIT